MGPPAGEYPSNWPVGGRSLPHCNPVSNRNENSRRLSTYAALQGTAVNVVAIELADSHGSILVSIHLDESKTAVALEASLNDITKVLEERDKI